MSVIVITGGSAGIGAETAKILAAQGHRIVLAARRKDRLEAVATEVKETGGEAVTVVADVTRREDVEQIREEALRAFGRVDVWINNAGRGITRQVLQLSDEDIDEVVAVKLKSALYGMQAIVPYFQEQGTGHLINVSSFLGRVPLVAFRSIYSASKAALNVLTTNLRMDLREEWPGIHVTLVMPPMVATEFHQNAIGGLPQFRPGGGPPMTPQSAEDCARAIAAVIEHPVPEVYTAPGMDEVARRYREDPEGFVRGR